MALSYKDHTGTGSVTAFAVPFPYLSRSHVFVTVDGVAKTFTWLNAGMIEVAPAPALNANVHVYRKTPSGTLLATFQDGSTLTKTNLDLAALQSVYLAEEGKDDAFDAQFDANATSDRLNAEAGRLDTRIDQIDGTVAVEASVVAVAASLTATNKATEATSGASAAVAAKTTAEAARDAALVGTTVYPDIAAGRAAVADNAYFKVVGDGVLIAFKLYKRLSSSTQQFIVDSPMGSRFGDLKMTDLGPDSEFDAGIIDPEGRLAFGVRRGTGTSVLFLDDEAEVPLAALDDNVQARLLPEGTESLDTGPDDDATGGFVDANLRPWLRFLPDGTTSLDLSADSTLPQAIMDRLTPADLFPSSSIVLWGDSMAEGVSGYTPWLTRLATLLGTTTFNRGRGSQTSSEIAARQGGTPTKITVTGDTIPASGNVAVTTCSIDIGYYGGTSAVLSFTGTLAGVSGTLRGLQGGSGTHGSGAYRFERATAGAAVPCPAGTPFIPNDLDTFKGFTGLLQAGRNNLYALDRVRDDILAMISAFSSKEKRVPVLGVCTAVSETSGSAGHTAVTALNRELAWVCGDRFIDIRRILIDRGIDLANIGFTLFGLSTITKTSQDISDIAADTLPRSLVHSDFLHFNEAGNMAVAVAVYFYFKARGW